MVLKVHKGGSFEWGEIAKFILLLLAVVIVFLLISLFRGGFDKILVSIKDLLGL